MKKIKDYLHLYLGAEAKMPGHTVIISHDLLSDEHAMKHWEIKPILRNLLDMKEDEIFEYAKNYGAGNFDGANGLIFLNDAGHIQIIIQRDRNVISLFPVSNYGNSPESFRYLLSKHFDLFGLIESGLAIDKSNKTIK